MFNKGTIYTVYAVCRKTRRDSNIQGYFHPQVWKDEEREQTLQRDMGTARRGPVTFAPGTQAIQGDLSGKKLGVYYTTLTVLSSSDLCWDLHWLDPTGSQALNQSRWVSHPTEQGKKGGEWIWRANGKYPFDKVRYNLVSES